MGGSLTWPALGGLKMYAEILNAQLHLTRAAEELNRILVHIPPASRVRGNVEGVVEVAVAHAVVLGLAYDDLETELNK